MKTNMLVCVAVLVAIAFPAGALAAKPTKTDKENAAKECKAERGTSEATREAFRKKYGNLGRCVSKKAKEEAAERKAARRKAAKECKAKRSHPGSSDEHYVDPFEPGECVSAKARKKKAAMDAEDEQEAERFKNAAKACDAERSDPNFAASHDGKTFEQLYGTNKNGKNAFGKCVSSKAGD
jgi:hypothetical protein